MFLRAVAVLLTYYALFRPHQRQEELYEMALERDQSMSSNRAMVNAMVENAKSSSWRENLENVSAAQDRFMFGSNASPHSLMKRITSRADDLMRSREFERQRS